MADQFHLFALPLQQKTKTCITFKILKLWKRTKKKKLDENQIEEVCGGKKNSGQPIIVLLDK